MGGFLPDRMRLYSDSDVCTVPAPILRTGPYCGVVALPTAPVPRAATLGGVEWGGGLAC